MGNGKSIPLYEPPQEHLSQGDVFCCRLLGTYGGTGLMIVRQMNGDPPPEKFSSASELKFVRASDHFQHARGHEIVSCQVEHLRFFVVASQTCDIAGVDHPPWPTCLVIKMISICDFVNGATLPLKTDTGGVETIHLARFLHEHLDGKYATKLKELCEHQFEYPGALRDALKGWKPDNNSKPQRFKTKLQSFLKDITDNKEGRTYYFPGDPKFKIPEAFVELDAIFPVNTQDLAGAKGARIASLANPYKEEFSNRLGNRFSRVAVPVPARGEKF